MPGSLHFNVVSEPSQTDNSGSVAPFAQPSLFGGCLCGAVRYHIEGAAQEVYHCHCSMCRRTHGALFASFAVVRKDQFIIDMGAETLSCYESSPGVFRFFCARCGCQIHGELERRPDARFYAIGTLDGGSHPGHAPRHERHVFVGSKVPWWPITDGLPQSEEF